MTKIKQYQMLINGQWVDASSGETFPSFNPANGQEWARIPAATEQDVNRAVASAKQALESGSWNTMTPTERGHYLRRLADLLDAHAEFLGKIESKDTGKLLKETRYQAKYIAEFFHFYAGCADKISGETLPIDKSDMFVYTRREPVGVVAAVVPWNSQLFLSAVKIGPALAAGNTIVLKASEYASAAMLEFGKLIEEAGIPPGVVNIVTGFGDPCGKMLTSHPDVARISFTGGPSAAQKVIQNSSNNFAQVSLELGGKSPILVFDDADIDSAVNGAVGGIFAASGQSCVAGSRLLLQESIADQFLEKMAAVAAQVQIGDPLDEDTDMGPLCTEAQLSHVQHQIDKALKQGGSIRCGGEQPQDLEGLYFQPTIIECHDPSMEIVDTELFAPVVSALRFKTESEAVELANQSKHGLAAGIFTCNNGRAIRLTEKIKAGIVWVNTYRVISPVAEFGGVKTSGYGRESGFQAVLDYTRPKTVWINTSDTPLQSQFFSR